MTESLYEKMGGETMLDAVIDLFYQKVLDDAELTNCLQSMSLDSLRPDHKQFFVSILGGESTYEPTNLKLSYQDAAARNGYNEDHFKAMTNHFRKAMDDLNVSPMVNIQAIMSLTKRGTFY